MVSAESDIAPPRRHAKTHLLFISASRVMARNLAYPGVPR
jgi:hypothetical protein